MTNDQDLGTRGGQAHGVDLLTGALTDEQFIRLMPPINPATPAYWAVLDMQAAD